MKSLLGWLRDGWLILGVTLLTVLLVDALLKAWLPEQAGWPRIVAGAEAPDRAEAEPMTSVDWAGDYFRELKSARHMRWQSYVYWRRSPFQGRFINVDEDGLRHTWQPAEADLELWLFGGSTVWGTGSRDDHTLASELARALELEGHSVRVTNFGESGYVSTQGLITLIQALKTRAHPDAVVFYDGVNDVFAALQSGTVGSPQNELRRQADFRVTDGLDNYLAAFPVTLEGIGRLLGSGQAPTIEPLAEELVEAYLNNVRSVRALGDQFGFESWFFWQPSVFTRETPSPFEQRVIDSSLIVHRDLQLAANGHLEALAPEVIDFSGLLDTRPEPLYLDFCHLSEAGNRLVAGEMAARIDAQWTSD
jgi:lysophospholipase L1-like esterase